MNTERAASARDVRMRGFLHRAAVEEVLRWIDEHAQRLEAETAELSEACGRILAEDVISPLDVPGFDRAAMDGYAVRAGETDGAGPYNPLPLRVIGAAWPGRPFAGRVQSGEAVQIMTGAPLPAGADAVVPAEYAEENSGTVSLTAAVSPGKHVGRTGEDVKKGDRLLPAGRWLRPQDVGLLASVGLREISVIRQPRVRLLITGNELILPGEPKASAQIYESNSFMLCGLVQRDGGVVESIRRLPDDRERLRSALTEPGADVILVSGGSSVGAEDHAPVLLSEAGELVFHGITMRPSSPTGIGSLGEARVVLLPGNPVSCLCAYDFFAGRIIRLRGGRGARWPYTARRVQLSRKISSAVGRVDYCRMACRDGQWFPLALSGASILSSTTRADGFTIVPAEWEGYPPGAEITVFLYEPPACSGAADGTGE